MDSYGLLFQKLLYPSWESALRRRPTLRHLRELRRTQWCSLDELTALQDQALRGLLAHTFRNVPHARERYARVGVHPGDVRGLGDLAKLPLLGREEAMEHLARRKSRAPPLATIDKSTSGTSGRPLVFAYDTGSEYWRQATKYGWAGYELGERTLHFWGSPNHEPPPLAQRLKASLDHSLRREHYVDCTARSDRALALVVDRIRRVRPKVLLCYAQAGAALARHVNQTGARTWGDISVICAAERLFPADRAALTQAFGPGIFETYGNREVMLIAAECEAHEGLHTSMENLIVELVVRDGERERPAEPGEVGEVALTDLHNYGAPFIRYLTGDLAVAGVSERCACGRWLQRLKGIEGRSTDTIRDAEGQPVSGMMFSVLFASLADRVRQFQVVQRKDLAIDLKLVPAPGFDPSLLEVVRSHVSRHVPGVEVRPEVVHELPPDRGGKLRVVVVEN